MAKTLKGKVVSQSMQETVVVEVVSKKPHPLYRKLLTRSKKFKVATNGVAVAVGDAVTIEETKPMAKGKYFKLVGNKKTGVKAASVENSGEPKEEK